mmetsp:Transcript_83745/g.249957  ORF Transcript_83745/g.249957 Transcript_83745/m.249957 type:complete len:250 (-) Transcript_83745:3-752(-)
MPGVAALGCPDGPTLFGVRAAKVHADTHAVTHSASSQTPARIEMYFSAGSGVCLRRGSARGKVPDFYPVAVRIEEENLHDLRPVDRHLVASMLNMVFVQVQTELLRSHAHLQSDVVPPADVHGPLQDAFAQLRNLAGGGVAAAALGKPAGLVGLDYVQLQSLVSRKPKPRAAEAEVRPLDDRETQNLRVELDHAIHLEGLPGDVVQTPDHGLSGLLMAVRCRCLHVGSAALHGNQFTGRTDQHWWGAAP